MVRGPSPERAGTTRLRRKRPFRRTQSNWWVRRQAVIPIPRRLRCPWTPGDRYSLTDSTASSALRIVFMSFSVSTSGPDELVLFQRPCVRVGRFVVVSHREPVSMPISKVSSAEAGPGDSFSELSTLYSLLETSALARLELAAVNCSRGRKRTGEGAGKKDLAPAYIRQLS